MDVPNKLETPDLSHIKDSDYVFVYEPSHDSFLMLDALETELDFIKDFKPAMCLEVGSGSGINISAFSRTFPSCLSIGVDINPKACEVSLCTSQANKAQVECVNMDLASCFRNNLADIVIFNPPYVVTDSLEIVKSDISRAWAGGIKGREVIDRFLAILPDILSTKGVCYMLVTEENFPNEICALLKDLGFVSETVIKRKAFNEKLQVMKISRDRSDSI